MVYRQHGHPEFDLDLMATAAYPGYPVGYDFYEQVTRKCRCLLHYFTLMEDEPLQASLDTCL